MVVLDTNPVWWGDDESGDIGKVSKVNIVSEDMVFTHNNN